MFSVDACIVGFCVHVCWMTVTVDCLSVSSLKLKKWQKIYSPRSTQLECYGNIEYSIDRVLYLGENVDGLSVSSLKLKKWQNINFILLRST